MNSVLRKEIRNYFFTPIGYIFLTIFIVISAFFFFSSVIIQNTSNISNLFQSIFMIILLLTPILTMRLFSEEYKSHTDQLLFSSPTTLFSIVLGKYFSALLMYLITISITLIYIFVVSLFASVTISLIIGCMLGIILLGASLISIGLFISSITKSQVIAAFGSFGVFLLFIYINTLSNYMPFDWLKTILNNLSMIERYNNLVLGILNISDLLYFLSIIVVFLFLTMRVLEKKRWS